MPKLTAEYIRSCLHYDPDTGIFTWLTGQRRGLRAGSRNWGGAQYYRYITIRGGKYSEHRIAWLWMTGSWPKDKLDHKDTNGMNNTWSNLRPATGSQNQGNVGLIGSNTSGYKGVHYHKGAGKWVARIHIDKKEIHLGTFSTPEEAAEAYARAAEKVFGEFARTEKS